MFLRELWALLPLTMLPLEAPTNLISWEKLDHKNGVFGAGVFAKRWVFLRQDSFSLCPVSVFRVKKQQNTEMRACTVQHPRKAKIYLTVAGFKPGDPKKIVLCLGDRVFLSKYTC